MYLRDRKGTVYTKLAINKGRSRQAFDDTTTASVFWASKLRI